MNNACSGSPTSTFTSPVGVCNNNNGDGEFFTCGTSPTPSRKISASSNIYPINILFFMVMSVFSFILI